MIDKVTDSIQEDLTKLVYLVWICVSSIKRFQLLHGFSIDSPLPGVPYLLPALSQDTILQAFGIQLKGSFDADVVLATRVDPISWDLMNI